MRPSPSQGGSRDASRDARAFAVARILGGPTHGLFELVVQDGKDVHAVVTRTRHVPEALKIAIEERGQTCKVRGCDANQHLERHHVQECAPNKITSYEVLGRLCPHHDDQVTYQGYTIQIHGAA